MIRELSYYDKIICSFSGGKDSTALILFMIENGAKPEQIEIWHQSIDGRADTRKVFFDWPSTDGYVREFADTFNLPLSYQWREYGFYGELFRENELTNDVRVDRNGKMTILPSNPKGNLSTRLKWPAKSASLMTRWCSAYLKIDVAARAL
jgi:3'-phosphoadenosine 5'-phosphosulfate sulfotransferase (PAPS reductase)/FAD synthetase